MLIDELLLFTQIQPNKESLNEKEIYEKKKENEKIKFTLIKNNDKLTSEEILLHMKKLE